MGKRMKELLTMFENCDSFSLSWAGIIDNIPQKNKDFLLKENLNIEKMFLKNVYEYHSNKTKNLPDFETCFSEIVEECYEFYNKLTHKENSSNPKHSPFICDHVGIDTKYCEPIELFWHFYHNIQHVIMSNEGLTHMPECEEFKAGKYFIKKEDSLLKKNLIRYEFTCQSHCTKGPLQLVLYFKLNDETKSWLLKLKDDFDLEKTNFEDLAFYENNKLKFSSCTHEHFNSL